MRIGLGMAALGRPGYINLLRDNDLSSRSIDGMQNQANMVMDELFQHCKSLSSSLSNKNDNDSSNIVPWLDCARSYGLSEKFVGDYLRTNNISPSDVYVSSKWGYTYVADWNVELEDGQPHEVKDHSLENFMKQVEETKEQIGPYLNLYQVHSATFDSGILTNTKVHNALHQICRVENGWKIGLSVSGPNQSELIREAMKIRVATDNSSSNFEDDGDSQNNNPSSLKTQRLFDSLQCTYNIFEQRPFAALLEAHNAGIDIIIKEGLANGRALSHPSLVELSQQLSCNPDQLALGFILAQPFKARVLSGAVTVQQLQSNLSSLYPHPVIDNNVNVSDLHQLTGKCCMDSEEYWKERSNLKWN